MPLRLLEVTLPDSACARVDELLAEMPVVERRSLAAGEGVALVRVLLDAQHVEAASDALASAFGSSEPFRIVVLPVEATLPALPEPAAQPPAAGQEAEAPPPPDRISREELYEDLAQASRVTPVYLVMVALSTVVAAVGLTRGDVAIVIGAMVIAPLLGPNVALALAATLADPALARRSLRAIGAGVAVAAALAVTFGAVFGVDPAGAQIVARTRAGASDVLLALAAGTAGSLAFTSGVSAVVVGVMVAVALLPPLVVAGLLVGAGDVRLAVGALVLLATNITCVNLAAVATFLVQRVRPRTWWQAERARRASRLAVLVWVAMLLALLALMFLAPTGRS